MNAMKEALRRKMLEQQDGKKPALEIAIGLGKPVADQEHADGQIEGDALDEKKLQEENDLAPESQEETEESDLANELAKHEESEGDMMQKHKILSALADGANHKGRTAMGLHERVAGKAREDMMAHKGMGKKY